MNLERVSVRNEILNFLCSTRSHVKRIEFQVSLGIETQSEFT